MTALVSCAFIPAGIKNYGLGTMKIPFWVYLLWTSLCGFPYSCANIMLGVAAQRFKEEKKEAGSPHQIADNYIFGNGTSDNPIEDAAQAVNGNDSIKLAMGAVVMTTTLIGICLLGRFCKNELERQIVEAEFAELELGKVQAKNGGQEEEGIEKRERGVLNGTPILLENPSP